MEAPPKLQASSRRPRTEPLHGAVGDNEADGGEELGGDGLDVAVQGHLAGPGLDGTPVQLRGLPFGPEQEVADVRPRGAVAVARQVIQRSLAPDLVRAAACMDLQLFVVAPTLRVDAEGAVAVLMAAAGRPAVGGTAAATAASATAPAAVATPGTASTAAPVAASAAAAAWKAGTRLRL